MPEIEKDSRSKILQTAILLFAQKGFNGVSIRELSKIAGVNSALISYYFGSKGGLYETVMTSQFAILNKKMAEIKTTQINPLDRIRGYALTIIALHEENPHLLRMVNREFLNPTPYLEKIISKRVASLKNYLVEAIEEAIAMGQLRADINPTYAALSLAGMMNFYFISQPISNQFVPHDSENNRKYAQQAIDIFLTGLIRRNSHE